MGRLVELVLESVELLVSSLSDQAVGSPEGALLTDPVGPGCWQPVDARPKAPRIIPAQKIGHFMAHHLL